MTTNFVPAGTLLQRILNLGVSPISTIMKPKPKLSLPLFPNDGLIDSLCFLVHHENFIKPWCAEFLLVSVLTAVIF